MAENEKNIEEVEPKDFKEAQAVIANLRGDKNGLEEKVGELSTKVDELTAERDEAKDEVNSLKTINVKMSKELEELNKGNAKLREIADKANVKFGYLFKETPDGLASMTLDGQSVTPNKEGVWKLTARQAELAADHGVKPVRVGDSKKR